ncbi:MAG: hypothetical protein JST58_06365 [Bacteroidetes bacterium]|nr:hypothetical protein [Bacteroidota bacterium]
MANFIFLSESNLLERKGLDTHQHMALLHIHASGEKHSFHKPKNPIWVLGILLKQD